ncbi:glutaminase domain-containing protein [Algisphaera agarilytica]|uniref:Glutaminase A central domain-containing protein n=1 Tax=Algisphaera agarilytica TaxID=1385975 RepID=A0A7X0H5H2_9BACT|nr:DUF4965 domain-containing protein [Algisphaera agarilytica]MBB6429427.1 hypothetical protein [Algisphaera agarilytica]
MQLMSWMIGRLGSRFGLMFEPYERRVMHSALGRFLDQPLDLAVGLIEPDGRQRVLPFTKDNDNDGVDQFANCEQFDRINSTTFRGYSERYGLRFEMNIHSVFYPQNERLCVMPAFYLEMRVNPLRRFRLVKRVGEAPGKVKLFIRLRRPETELSASDNTIRMAYDIPLKPADPWERPRPVSELAKEVPTVHAEDRIVSLNPGCEVTPCGQGLTLDLPVTRSGSGTKWRLVWASHVAEPVLTVKREGEIHQAKLRYNQHWPDVDAVAQEAIKTRDERLALSRRFEKLLEQAPLDASQRHLNNQSFQNFLCNTFWCDTIPSPEATEGLLSEPLEWFSVWDGSPTYHSALDVEYNNSLFYLAVWPRLLKVQLRQWVERSEPHEPSGGRVMRHDLGVGMTATDSAYDHRMPVEENANFLLLLETLVRWTGDKQTASAYLDVAWELARYLIWTDRDASGFPTEGVANAMVDAAAAMQYARKQTYLAVKRVAALRAAAGMFRRSLELDKARECEQLVERDTRKIEEAAWLGDHYAVAVDKSAVELTDPVTGEPLEIDELPGWDAYSIYTANGLLLPELIGQPPLLDRDRLTRDVYRSNRECNGRYGDGHSSLEPNNPRISQNIWRDLLARYLRLGGESSAQQYWDLQVMSNTHSQSLGYTDTYIHNRLHNYPRGVVTMGYYLATPRLMIDRLAPGAVGTYITVDPDRHTPQRWPLLPLADWQAGKIPVCVVQGDGRVLIEAITDPVVIQGEENESGGAIPGTQLIG